MEPLLEHRHDPQGIGTEMNVPKIEGGEPNLGMPVEDDHDALTFHPLPVENPKDAIGSSKLPLNLVPDTLAVYAAMSFAEGASKYGAFNWRGAGVRFSIYYAAMQRHQKKLWNGEWADPETKVPHLASIIACAGIIADAYECGKLTDDRPPPADLPRVIAQAEAIIRHVAAMHADKRPHHWTIGDRT